MSCANRRNLFVVAIVGMLVGITGCVDCDNWVVERSRSPNREYDAVVFSAVCGFGMSVNTQVSVVKAGREAKGKGNALSVIFADTAGTASRIGSPAVEARWLAPDTLKLTYYRSAKVLRNPPRVGDVVLLYEMKEDPPRTP
ncbi:MAG TPA: hypothetical protein VF746_10200 [Longimicrobium sp.]|jgi:hypothetical protein